MASVIPDIHFFYEDTSFTIEGPEQLSAWILKVIDHYDSRFQELNYIFCSDAYLLQVNQDYLQHDYYTDIITFCNSEDPISSDIFISIDRVRDNASQLEEAFEQELLRVMAHGILHLIGFDDKSADSKLVMREQETSCVAMYQTT